LSAASTSSTAKRSAASGFCSSPLIYRTISSISFRATGKYSNLYNLFPSNSGFHRFQHLFGGIALIRQLGLSLSLLQLEIYLALELQVFKCLHAQNNHITIAILCQKNRLSGFM